MHSSLCWAFALVEAPFQLTLLGPVIPTVALGALSDVRQYTVCEVKTALTKVDLPAWLIFLPFQTVSFLTNLSTSGWKSILRNLVLIRGRPKYLVGTRARLAGKSRRTSSKSTPWHLMGMTDDFRTFVLSTDAAMHLDILCLEIHSKNYISRNEKSEWLDTRNVVSG